MKNFIKTFCIILSLALFSCGKDDEPKVPPIPEEPETPPAEQINQINGHEYADLGLSVYWATVNLGANTPEEYGNYYAWGEIGTKEDYSRETYEYYKNNSYINIGNNISGTKYDAVHFEWGSSWRMPTIDEFNELEANCKKEVTFFNGVRGCKYTGPNGKSIFLPYAGHKLFNVIDDRGIGFVFWSATTDNLRSYVYLYQDGLDKLGLRYMGFSLRGVSNK